MDKLIEDILNIKSYKDTHLLLSLIKFLLNKKKDDERIKIEWTKINEDRLLVVDYDIGVILFWDCELKLLFSSQHNTIIKINEIPDKISSELIDNAIENNFATRTQENINSYIKELDGVFNDK